MSVIKVAWCVFRVKNMHPGSTSHPSWTAAAEAKPRYVYSILKPHGQSFRGQVRPMLSEATPTYVYSILKLHSQISKSPVRLLLSEAKLSYVYSMVSKSHVRLLPREAKLSYVYTFLKKHHLPRVVPSSCVR